MGIIDRPSVLGRRGAAGLFTALMDVGRCCNKKPLGSGRGFVSRCAKR